MSFLTLDTAPRQRIVPGIGPPDAKIAIVGEAPGAYEEAQLKPFVGPAGSVLEQCLHAAGLIRSTIYLTNTVKVRPKANDISPFFNGKTFSADGMAWVESLREELNALNPNVIVACGKTAMAALTGATAITKLRGYVMESIELARPTKVIPCIHPAACLYDRKGGDKGSLATKEFKPYLFRYVITCDLKKAKELSTFSEIGRPVRQLVYEFQHISEVIEWLDYFMTQPIVSVDIETPSSVGEMVCIGLSSDPNIAVSIPFDERWTEQEELELWRALQRVLGNNSTKVFQNAVFDTWFLRSRYGFDIKGPMHDTMVAHSCMFPELPKGLGFLGSIYCQAQEYWKDKVNFNSLKEEA